MAFEEDPVLRKMAREAIEGSARAGKSVRYCREWLRRVNVTGEVVVADGGGDGGGCKGRTTRTRTKPG